MAVEILRMAVDSLTERARAAGTKARASCVAVDREARFPREAFDEIRAQRLLGIMVPQALGGDGATLAQVADVCYVLGQNCASTALVFAMHQIKVACVVRHAGGNPAIEKILWRVAADQLLLASSTTEGQAGGIVRASEAAVHREGTQITLERKATVISYAREADGIVTTARRSPESGPSDQVLVVLLKADYSLEQMQGWDTLGMRGTHSEGFTLRARAAADQVLSDAYEKIHSRTMVPHAHLLWGSVWAGIATSAMSRAQAFLRQALRQSGGQLPPGAPHYTQGLSSLRLLRGVLATGMRSYASAMTDDKVAASLEFQSQIALTKVQASELAVAAVLSALRACGLSGYRNDGEFSIGRHLRDILSSPLMINNDRILANLTTTSLLATLPDSLSG